MTFPWTRTAPWIRTDPWPGPDSSADTAGLTDLLTWEQDVHSAASADATATTDAPTGGADYTKSPADSAGLSDSVTADVAPVYPWVRTAQWNRSDPWPGPDTTGGVAADALGLTDQAAWAQDVHSAWSAAVQGTTDPPGGSSASAADTLGGADTASITQGKVRSPADTAGLSDTATVTRAYSRATADPLGGTDSVTRAAGLHRAAADTLGLADDHDESGTAVNVPLTSGDATVTAQPLAEVTLAVQDLGTATVTAPTVTAALVAVSTSAALAVEDTSAALFAQDVATAALVDATGTASIYT